MSNVDTKTGILIVSWNGRPHLEKLLPSISSQHRPVVVVDNGSVDMTEEFLLGEHPGVHCIKLSKNKGFAKANNVGIQFLFKKYSDMQNIIFLNNDTIVSSNFVEILEGGLERHPDAATVQTKIVSMDRKNIDSAGVLIDKSFSAINRGQGEVDLGQYEKEEEIFGSTASAMIISRRALEAVALREGEYFDNTYFAYNEDVDLALRLRLAGFSSWFIPGGEVRHVHSATGVSYSAFKAYHIHRNTIFNIIKNAPSGEVYRILFNFIKRYGVLLKEKSKENTSAYKLNSNIGFFRMICSS